MRKADRLFQIIQILRRSSRPVTAAELAAELEVGRRTVYRDIADLVGQRVPIDGEAGLGYLLDPDYDMPPLMLTPDEIEAVLLGLQLVERLGDRAITLAARDAISKISATVPDHLLPVIAEPAVGLKPLDEAQGHDFDTRPARRAIREGRKLRLTYRDGKEDVTERTIWPVAMGYADDYLMLIGWCELRAAFRHFRADRIVALQALDEPIGMARTRLRRQWLDWREAERAASSRPPSTHAPGAAETS